MASDRNAPCPCGSGRKFKKCHGAALPPEAAALPAPERERLQRAVQLLERDRRVHTELNDWCDRKLGPDWANAALDEFAGAPDVDLSEFDESFYGHWLLHHRPAASGQATPAKQWLEAQRARHGHRMDGDIDALITALGESRVGFWRIQDVEPGVGYTLHDLLSNSAAFVHDDTGALGDIVDDVCLAYVTTLDDLQIVTGAYLDLLPREEAEQVVEALREAAGMQTQTATAAPLRAFLGDYRNHITLRNLWHTHANAYWEAQDHDHEQHDQDLGVLDPQDPRVTDDR